MTKTTPQSVRRRFGLRGGFFVAAVAALAVIVPAQAAHAEVYYDEGGCVVQQLIDGPPAGGSQCAGVDLSGLALGQANFTDANLAGTNLSGTKLQGAIFKGADITGANFGDAQLEGADFTGAGIVPEVLDVQATSATGSTAEIPFNVPTGITAGQCTIVDVPIDGTTVFPVGESGVLCRFTAKGGAAIAVVRIVVAAPEVATDAPEPLFSDEPGAAGTESTDEIDWGMISLVAGSALGVLVLGAAAIWFSRRRPAAAEESEEQPEDSVSSEV